MTSLLTPLTPCEHRPYAAFCTFNAQRDVEPAIKMFSVPASFPVVSELLSPPTLVRLRSWVR